MTPHSMASYPESSGRRRNGSKGSRRRSGLGEDAAIDGSRIVGSSPAILAALKMAERIAETEIPVLLMGETGTGKELFARHIHRHSGRDGRLVCVDCGALPTELTESLLFGHARGAFTGAVSESKGLISQANGGTLVLDELSSLPPRGQAKLLRVLETGMVRRVGGDRPRSANFRLVATVLDDFSELIESGGFRKDLLQRIAGMVIELPRLDERRGDVPILARHFADLHGVGITTGAEEVLDDQSWRGNVRELRWTVARSALFAGSDRIDVPAVQEALAAGPSAFLDGDVGATPSRRRQELRATCEAYEGDPDQVAEALGIARSTLYRWLKDVDLELRDFRTGEQMA